VPLDLPLLLSRTNHYLSLAPVGVDVDNATYYDVMTQCGAGGQPKLDLIRTHTRL